MLKTESRLPIYTLAVSSFAVHGTASLKTLTAVLGSSVLPVPSLLLNGLTNMQMVKKFEVPFDELIESSLELIKFRKLKAILYIGYLANAKQVESLLGIIPRYKDFISTIIVDPISGDHGKAYVPDSLWQRLPDLIRMADISFPNLTEIKLMTGFLADDQKDYNFYMDAYKITFNSKPFVLTSLPFNEEEIGFAYFDGNETFIHKHKKLLKNFGGTGDAFLAYFIRNHFYYGGKILSSLKKAAEETFGCMEKTIGLGREDLYI